MKRILMVTLLALSAVALISAQGMNRNGPGNRGDNRATPQVVSEKITVTGNLSLANGMIAIKSNDITYLIPGLMRYVGFIDGIKEGSQVTIEGNAISRQADAKTKVLSAQKLTIGNKEYEMGMPNAFGNMQQNKQWPGQPQPGIQKHNRNHGNQGRIQNQNNNQKQGGKQQAYQNHNRKQGGNNCVCNSSCSSHQHKPNKKGGPRK